ncbi:hypothetical protein AVEN_43075-1 [Araneus ventricosus]|uniref:DUF4371 domain-containing protein n=1 Tax=Araneus ventricosus TaxID=182803 RepID=A0A4Y2M5R9_ARAVE|nr:hypothetical protein AVEN_43075-1 [Araneus ventricosus]
MSSEEVFCPIPLEQLSKAHKDMRLCDHVYPSANCIAFSSHPNSHRLDSRRVVSQSSSDSAVDITLHVCKFNRLRFLRVYSLVVSRRIRFRSELSSQRCVLRHKRHGTSYPFRQVYVVPSPKEELLGLLPLSGQTRGEDIANAVQKCLGDNGIDINKIVSIATDGARSMA